MKTASILAYIFQLVASSQYHSISRNSTLRTPSQSHAYTSYHLNLQGKHGLKLPISLPKQPNFDYTLQLAFKANAPLNQQRQTIFEIEDGPSCSISLLSIECNTNQTIALETVPNPYGWLQLTYSGNHSKSSNSTSLLRLDQPDFTVSVSGYFKQINSNQVFIGLNSTQSEKSSFLGQIREFYLYAGLINPSFVMTLAHNVKQFQTAVMAYYRFEPSIGILADSFRDLTGQVIKSDPSANNPILIVDEGTKLVCDPLEMNPLLKLPTFTKETRTRKVRIPNFQFVQSQYQYTVSLWIKPTGDHVYSASPLDGINSLHFLMLENVLALWFDSPSSFRAYLFSAKDYLEEATSSISFPLHQWINIQVQIDQKNGMRLAAYSQSGYLIRMITLPATSLDLQMPTGNIELFRNFRGQASSFRLWQRSYQLPVAWDFQEPAIVDFDFSYRSYGENRFMSLNQFNLPISGLEFTQTKVPMSVNYTNPSTIGVFNSNETLWDGSGCKTSPKNLVLVEQGPISSQFQMEATKAMTVELWFKFKELPGNATFNLHSLQAVNKWSLSIFVEDGVLKCAPFGKASHHTLVYRNISQERRWQHVSCGFTQQEQVVGQYLAYNTSQQNVMPETFSLPLLGSELRSPNYLIALQFTSQLGSALHACYFRDVRVWSHIVSISDLFTYRFRQLNSMTTPGLQLNYKLVDGNPDIVNESKRTNKQTKGTVTLNIFEQDLVLCPSDRYFSPQTAMCYQTPYLDDMPFTYTAQVTQQYGLELLFTNKYTQTNLLLPTHQPDFTQTWTINDKAIYASSIKQQAANDELVISPFTLGDGYQYEIGLLKKAKDYSFWSNQTQVFNPRKCHYLVDTETQKSFTQVTTSKQNQLCLNFQVLQVAGCYSNFYNKLRPEVTIDSSPNIPSLQNQTQFTVDTQAGTVKACLPSSLLATIEQNAPINLVMSVYWSTDKVQSQAWSYINTVYQLIVVEPISAVLVASSLSIDIAETALFNSSASAYTASGSKEGLYYRWVCPIIFQELCDRFEGAPLMEITPEAFRSYGGTSKRSYTFKVEIYNFKSGPVPLNPKQIFTASVSVVWATFAIPIFDIVIPLLPGQTVPKVVSSQQISLTVDLKNYRASDSRLSYEWRVTPQPQSKLFSKSLDGSVFTLLEGALLPNTSYSCQLVIQNTEVGADKCTGINYLNFTTGTPPTKGNLYVTPASGTMFETSFVIMVNNWVATGGGGLKLNVWAITQTEPKKMIQIGQSMQDLPAQGLTLPGYSLPLIKAVQIDVYDVMGEKSSINKTITVVRDKRYTNWPSSTNKILTDYESWELLEQKYLYLAFVSQNCNNDVVEKATDASSCLNSTSIMVTQATKDLIEIQSNLQSVKAVSIAASVVAMLKEVTTEPETLSPSIAEKVITLLQGIQGKTNVFSQAMQLPAFQQDFLQAIANLIAYETAITIAVLQGRRLQSDEPQSVIDGLIVLKNDLLDVMCQHQSSQTILTTTVQLVTEQLAISDRRKDLKVQSKLDQTSISLPVDELLRTSRDYAPLVQSVCLQLTFMANNPVPKYLFTDQQVLDITFVQVASLDNLGNRILMSHGLTDLKMNPVRISIPINKDLVNFQQNQTVCMAYNANGKPDPWSPNKCETFYTANGLYCDCYRLNNHYYAVVNDLTRVPIIETTEFYQFTWPFVIIVALLLPGLLMPCVAVCLDWCDRRSIEQDSMYQVSDELIAILVEKRHYSCNQVVYFKMRQIKTMQQLKSFGCWQAYQLLSSNIHPCRSLFSKFDYKHKRLVRVSILMLQVALVSITVIGVFVRGWDYEHQYAPYVYTAIAGFFLLPLPQTALSYISSNLQVTTSSATPDPEVKIIDHCTLIRYLLVITSYLLYALSVSLMALFTSGIVQGEYNFRVEEQRAITILVVWAATLLWGYWVLNGVRVMFIAVVAMLRAKQIKSAETSEPIDKQKGSEKLTQNNIDQKSCIYWLIPYEGVEICLDAMYTIEIYDMLNQRPSQTAIQPNDATQDQLFDTQHKERPDADMNASNLSAEMTDLSHRTHSQRSQMPVNHRPRIQLDEKQVASNDVDLEKDLKDTDQDFLPQEPQHEIYDHDDNDLHKSAKSNYNYEVATDRRQRDPKKFQQIESSNLESQPVDLAPVKQKKDKKHKKSKKHRREKSANDDDLV